MQFDGSLEEEPRRSESRSTRSRKSIVALARSTARYRYSHWPATSMQVSSIAGSCPQSACAGETLSPSGQTYCDRTSCSKDRKTLRLPTLEFSLHLNLSDLAPAPRPIFDQRSTPIPDVYFFIAPLAMLSGCIALPLPFFIMPSVFIMLVHMVSLFIMASSFFIPSFLAIAM